MGVGEARPQPGLRGRPRFNVAEGLADRRAHRRVVSHRVRKGQRQRPKRAAAPPSPAVALSGRAGAEVARRIKLVIPAGERGGRRARRAERAQEAAPRARPRPPPPPPPPRRPPDPRPAGQAKPAPPVGPAIGQAGVNIVAFCKDFNDASKGVVPGTPLRARVDVRPDRSYALVVGGPPTAWLLKRAAGLDRPGAPGSRPGREPGRGAGSARPGVDPPCGVVTLKHCYHIAREKLRTGDFAASRYTEETATRSVVAQAASIGLAVVRDEAEARLRFPECDPEGAAAAGAAGAGAAGAGAAGGGG